MQLSLPPSLLPPVFTKLQSLAPSSPLGHLAQGAHLLSSCPTEAMTALRRGLELGGGAPSPHGLLLLASNLAREGEWGEVEEKAAEGRRWLAKVREEAREGVADKLDLLTLQALYRQVLGLPPAIHLPPTPGDPRETVTGLDTPGLQV